MVTKDKEARVSETGEIQTVDCAHFIIWTSAISPRRMD